MNLDDFDKIPCSAKEAWRWMETKGNYCQQETMPTCIVRISEGRKLEGKILNLTPPDEWSVYDGPGLLAYDWFKLVPKKRERGSRTCDRCRFLFPIEDPLKFLCPGCEPKPDRFAAINTLIATYCDKISATHVMAAFLQDFARAIVDLIEKGKV